MRLDLESPDDEGPNLTPLIDVVFLLLVFFLVATTFAEDESELDLELPKAQNGSDGRDAEILVIELAQDGAMRVDGRSVNEQALMQKLRAAAARNPEREVLIRGDGRVEHRHVVAALDACKAAELRRVAIGAVPIGTRGGD